MKKRKRKGAGPGGACAFHFILITAVLSEKPQPSLPSYFQTQGSSRYPTTKRFFGM